MKCRFKNKILFENAEAAAFTLPEVVTALVILALFSSSILVVMNRCMAAIADSEIEARAFEVARENMETLLTKDNVMETVDYGVSDKYPEIEWQTTIESFSEPTSGRTWLKAICEADYIDATGEEKKIELCNWLAYLNDAEVGKLMDNKIAKTPEDAAKYAGVDPNTIQQWVDNGMPVNPDGSYNKDDLDFYKQHGGKPTAEAQQQHEAESAKQTASTDIQANKASNNNPGTKKGPPGNKSNMTPEQKRELINSILKQFQR
jgi:prepilin-type N-terminal cleavage/methylation domain-containing protein